MVAERGSCEAHRLCWIVQETHSSIKHAIGPVDNYLCPRKRERESWTGTGTPPEPRVRTQAEPW